MRMSLFFVSTRAAGIEPGDHGEEGSRDTGLIAMLEKGRENPMIDVLRRLSKALEITLTELLK